MQHCNIRAPRGGEGGRREAGLHAGIHMLSTPGIRKRTHNVCARPQIKLEDGRTGQFWTKASCDIRNQNLSGAEIYSGNDFLGCDE